MRTELRTEGDLAQQRGDHGGGSDRREYARGVARAFGGAILFAFPLMMTMEMWWIGFYIDRLRLLIFLLFGLAMLVPLSRLVGFEHTSSWIEDVIDAVVAFGVGIAASAVLLAAFAVIGPGMSLDDIVGKIAIQTVPASLGAILARKQMTGGGGEEADAPPDDAPLRDSYTGQLVTMAAGALFLAFNVAPTEEMILIAFKMTALHAIALVLLSIILLHAFVFALGFAGQEDIPRGMPGRAALIIYSLAGYGVAVLISLFVLWTFGRTDNVSLDQLVAMVVVLGFPSALGAASARLVI